MTGIFGFLFFISVCVLFIGLIKPGIVLRWGKKRSRGRVLLIYGLASLLFVSLGAATTPQSSSPPTKSVASIPGGNSTAKNTASLQSGSAPNDTNESTISIPTTNGTTPGTPATSQILAASSSLARSNPLAGVYHPYRLEVLSALKTVSGVVYSIRHESDKDYHLNLKLDSPYANLINAKNISVEHGCLVVEVIPMDPGKVPVPSVGQHITVTGAYVLDKDHGWNEIHPAWLINGQGSVSYTQAAADTSVQTGLIGNGDEQVTGTTTTPPSSTIPIPPVSTGTGSVPASSSIKVTSSNLNVTPGEYASVTVQTAPGASGTIEVDYESGPSKSTSLVPQTADSQGYITWEWKVGTRTTLGTWLVIITVNGKSIQVSLNVQ